MDVVQAEHSEKRREHSKFAEFLVRARCCSRYGGAVRPRLIVMLESHSDPYPPPPETKRGWCCSLTRGSLPINMYEVLQVALV